MLKKPPGLRYHSFNELAQRTRFGTIWAVSDRRTPQKNIKLFIPNRFRCWPRYLTILSALDPVPVRLRNQKVALLLSGEVEAAIKFIRNSKSNRRFSFNAYSGFDEVSSQGNFRKWAVSALIAVGSLLMTHFWMLPPASVPKEKSTTSKCIYVPDSGLRIPEENLVQHRYVIGSDELTFSYKVLLGGFSQIRIRRQCDGKLFTAKGWLAKDGLTISELY